MPRRTQALFENVHVPPWLLKEQEEDAEHDEGVVSVTAAISLMPSARVVQCAIVPAIIPFVEAYIWEKNKIGITTRPPF